jgi:hypothetical protein
VRVGTAVLRVDGRGVGEVHGTVLEQAARLAVRLGLPRAAGLSRLPAVFAGDSLRGLRRDLDQVMAFADCSQRTGWVLGEVGVAPGDAPVWVMDTERGSVWARAGRGFELRTAAGVERIEAGARRTSLARLIAPVALAVATASQRGGSLEIVERS